MIVISRGKLQLQAIEVICPKCDAKLAVTAEDFQFGPALCGWCHKGNIKRPVFLEDNMEDG